MLIQINLHKELHKKLMIEKVKRENKTLAETIIQILNEKLEGEVVRR